MVQKYFYQLLALLWICSPCWGDTKNSTSGFMDFNIYPYLSDVDTDSVITINLASSLSNGFSYFSLTNFGNQNDASELGDTVNYYTEQNLRWRLHEKSSLDLTWQSNFRSGEDNDRHRLGFRLRLNDSRILKSFFEKIGLRYSINFHLLQFDDADESIWQIEHVFRYNPSCCERTYIAGFIDHTFNEDLPDAIPSNPIVGEIQSGYRLIENFYGVVEYWINEYRRSDVNNLAVGFEYLIRW